MYKILTGLAACDTLLTLAPPCGYTLNPQALIKVSSQLLCKYCDLHMKENFISQKEKNPKSPGPIKVKFCKFYDFNLSKWLNFPFIFKKKFHSKALLAPEGSSEEKTPITPYLVIIKKTLNKILHSQEAIPGFASSRQCLG